jgi:HAMP domain-containing protein
MIQWLDLFLEGCLAALALVGFIALAGIVILAIFALVAGFWIGEGK